MRVALIVPEDPAVSRHGGTMRTAAFIRAFTELGHEARLMLPEPSDRPEPRVPAAATPKAGATSRLGELKRTLSPMPTALGFVAQRGLHLRRELDAFDLVLFSNFESRIMVPRRLRSRTWFDQADAHSRYAASEAAHRAGAARVAALGQSRWLRMQERRWVRRSAISTAAGFGDAEYVSGRDGTVEWLPTPVDSGGTAPVPGTRTVGMIGNFAYRPNRLAYESFVRDWLPTVRAQGWRALVAGRGSDGLRPADDVELVGAVGSVADFYRRIDVAICPVERGGGIKVKALEALVHGRPVLASEHTADGLAPQFRRLLVVCGSASELPDLSALRPDPDDVRAAQARFSSEEFTGHVTRLLERWRTNVL